MQQYIIPADVVANLTTDLSDLDVELQRVDVVMGRTYSVLVACSVLSGLLLAVEIFKMYRKRRANSEKQYQPPTAARTGECEDNRV
jgi:hypothetical protein